MAIIGMGMTDVIVAGNTGVADLAGVMIGSNIAHVIALFFFGIGMANSPLIGRHFGTLNWEGIRKQIHQSAWLSLAGGLLTVLIVYLVARYIHLWNIDTDARDIASKYLLAVIPGTFCLAIFPLFRSTLEAMNEIYLVMKVIVAAFVLNIFVDYWFVFGGFGMPAMGGVGCGWATSLILTIEAIVLAAYLLLSPKYSHLKLLYRFPKPDWSRIKPTLLLGLPIGLSILMEMGFFGGIALRMADIGVTEAGAHAVAINIAAFIFMLFYSIGQAVTVRASQYIGRKAWNDARQTVKLGMASVLALSLATCLLTLALRNTLPLLFTQDPEVLALASLLLVYAALFQLFDGIQAVAMCALRAYKDTAIPSLIQGIAFWGIGMPLGIALPFWSFNDQPIGSGGVWLAFCVALFVSSAILCCRMYWVIFRPSARLHRER